MIGPVRRVNLNFDKNGRSKGTASVVFQRRADAVRSVEKMRNITLDGREIKIEIVVVPGTNSGANPISQRIGNLQERSRVAPIRGAVSGAPRGLPTRGGGRGRGGIRGGRGGGRRPDNRQKKTQQELDAEIGEYMQIDEQESNQTAIDSVGKQN